MSTVFIFPGQGSQYVGMGKKLYNNYDFAKRIFDKANTILGYDIKEICFKHEIAETDTFFLLTSFDIFVPRCVGLYVFLINKGILFSYNGIFEYFFSLMVSINWSIVESEDIDVISTLGVMISLTILRSRLFVGCRHLSF